VVSDTDSSSITFAPGRRSRPGPEPVRLRPVPEEFGHQGPLRAESPGDDPGRVIQEGLDATLAARASHRLTVTSRCRGLGDGTLTPAACFKLHGPQPSPFSPTAGQDVAGFHPEMLAGKT